MQGGVCRPMPRGHLQCLISTPSQVYAPFDSSRTALQAAVLAIPVTVPLSSVPNKSLAFQTGIRSSTQPECSSCSTDIRRLSGISPNQSMQDTLRASDSKQRPPPAAMKQCVVLGAAAFIAAPAIFVLDVAEQAAWTLQRIRQFRLWFERTHCKTAVDMAKAVPLHEPSGVQQPQQQFPNYISISTPPTNSSRHSSHHPHPLSKQPAYSSNSTHRHLLLPDLWPPFALMALAVMPLLILLIRHAVIGSNRVLQPLLWCAASLVGQGYLNILLAALQRGPGPAVAAAAVVEPEQQSLAWNSQDEELSSASAAVGARPALQDLGGVVMPSKRQIQQQDTNPVTHCKSLNSFAALFRAVQIVGDAFRLACMFMVASLLWHEQAAGLLTWARDAVTSSHGLWHSIMSHRAVSTLPLRLLSAQLPAAQQSLSIILWLVVDLVACVMTATAYALACAARLHPVLATQ